MNNYSKVSAKKDTALRQQSLLHSYTDIVANLAPVAKQMGIDISLSDDEKIVISRWQFSRKFHDTSSAIQFLSEMGVTP
jgi:hypothetical protein